MFTSVEFPDGWKFNPWFRTENFGDAVRQFPNDLSIVDYIEICSDAYVIGDIIKEIFNKLDKGVAVIAIQKKYGADMGRGAEFSLEKPSLYLSVEKNTIKIIKAKEWRGIENPNGKMRKFKLLHGSEFLPEGEWASAEAWEQAQPKSKKWGIG